VYLLSSEQMRFMNREEEVWINR